MLATRLLSILLILQTRGRCSASALAREFEVSVRTIHRDIDQLSAAGIPVFASRGRSGGFELLGGYHTRLTGLTGAEAEAIFLAGLPGPASQLGLGGPLSAARLKLAAALPESLRPDAGRAAARIHLDAEAWFHRPDELPFLPLLARAVWDERVVELRYRRAGEHEALPRRLGPLGLVLKGGIWYLVALDGKRTRSYRVANITEARVTDKPFERPEPFDLPAYWEKSRREYEAAVYRERAEVRLSPTGRRRLELLGPAVVEAALRSAGAPDREGWVRCVIPLETIESGARALLHLGTEVEVLAPAELRATLAQTAQRISAMHA